MSTDLKNGYTKNHTLYALKEYWASWQNSVTKLTNGS